MNFGLSVYLYTFLVQYMFMWCAESAFFLLCGTMYAYVINNCPAIKLRKIKENCE